MPNRCGAKGIIVRKVTSIGVKVTSLISEVTIGHRNIPLPEDISAGQFIPMINLFEEHRGLVIVDDQDTCIDEGEIWPIKKDPDNLQFVSDYDGKLTNIPVENLIGYKIKIKPEIFDELNASKRLREFKKLF